MTDLTADRPSILDVANHCGLSKATVSKALNAPADSKLVSARTRARVQDAVKKLGYRPNWSSDDRGHAVRREGRAGGQCLSLGRFDRRVLPGGTQERGVLCGDKRGWGDETISGDMGKNFGR